MKAAVFGKRTAPTRRASLASSKLGTPFLFVCFLAEYLKKGLHTFTTSPIHNVSIFDLFLYTGISGSTSNEVSEGVGLNYPTLSYANGPAAYLELQSLRETGFRRNLTEQETSEFAIKSVSLYSLKFKVNLWENINRVIKYCMSKER